MSSPALLVVALLGPHEAAGQLQGNCFKSLLLPWLQERDSRDFSIAIRNPENMSSDKKQNPILFVSKHGNSRLFCCL